MSMTSVIRAGMMRSQKHRPRFDEEHPIRYETARTDQSKMRWDPTPPWRTETGEFDHDDGDTSLPTPTQKIPWKFDGAEVEHSNDYREYWATLDLARRLLRERKLTCWDFWISRALDSDAECNPVTKRISISGRLLNRGMGIVEQSIRDQIEQVPIDRRASRMALHFGRAVLREHKLAVWKLDIIDLQIVDSTVWACSNWPRRRIFLDFRLLRLGSSVIRAAVLHEVAHVLCGKRVRHGLRWQKKALALGVPCEHVREQAFLP